MLIDLKHDNALKTFRECRALQEFRTLHKFVIVFAQAGF